MSDSEHHPARDFRAWERILKNELIPDGIRSGKIRLLDANEISTSPCLVASGAPRNISGTHASEGYPGGREAWIRALECWFRKMPYDSLIGTLRRPYQHAARASFELPSYEDLPARKTEAEEVRIYCWPEHYGLTTWRRPAASASQADWEDIVHLLAAEIKYRKAQSSTNPYGDTQVSDPIGRIRDWETAVDLSRKMVLRSSDPWDRRQWMKSASKAIWKVNRLSGPRARIATETGKWEVLPDIDIPSPSSFNSGSAIHMEIEKIFLKSVESYEARRGKRLDRVIRKDQDIVSWWERLCSMSRNELRKQSYQIGELWKEAENTVRERHGLPRIGEGWISEVELLNLIRNCFPNETVIHHASPGWLGRQHLDIFLPERNLAIEYQGEQHFVPIDYFGGWDGLYKTRKRDKRKARLCAQHGVELIYFRFDEALTKDLVRRRIKEAPK